MKHEYRAPHPADLKPSWPGQFELFSWLNHVATIPGVVLITTRKESGAPNACLHAWGLLAGEKDHYASVLAVPDYTHTYANILRENEWASTSRVSIGTRGVPDHRGPRAGRGRDRRGRFHAGRRARCARRASPSAPWPWSAA